jgi:hypothetical protein
MSHRRIDRLIEARSLEEVPAEDAEVAAIWAAALREWADASVPGLSVPGGFIHVYQAAFRAATAMLRGAGYRVRGAVGGHQYVTFYALGALGDEAMERVADTLQNVRGGRHAALYGDEEELEPDDLQDARSHVSQLLGLVHGALIATRPALSSRLAPPR